MISCVVAASCNRAEQRRYDFKGKVVSVDKKGGTVTIAHEEIPGYMDGMTMPFRLKDPQVFDVVAEGDNLQATLVIDGDRSWLEDVVVARLMATAPGEALPQGNIGPSPGDEVPDFTLVNQDARRISLAQYRGRMLLLTFIYTRCPLPDYCPLMSEQFREINRSLASEPALFEKTHLLSISVDPDYDTPKVLREYGLEYATEGQESFKHWEFATGTRDEVKKVAEYFGLQYFADKGQIIHSLSTALVGPDGKIVKLYRGNEWRAATVVKEIKDFDDSSQARAGAGENVHRGVGVVEEVDKEMATVHISHEDIKDFMPAMTMPFPVKDKSLLEVAGAGDRVEFAIEATATGMVLVEIKKR